MEKRAVIQQLTKLHDAMVYGGQIIPDGELIQAVFEAAQLIEGQPKIFYLCDGKACQKGCRSHLGSGCKHTANPMHAKNFVLIRPGRLFERDPADACKPSSQPVHPDPDEKAPDSEPIAEV